MVKNFDPPRCLKIFILTNNTSEENSSFLHLNRRKNAVRDYFFAAKVVALITRNLSETCLKATNKPPYVVQQCTVCLVLVRLVLGRGRAEFHCCGAFPGVRSTLIWSSLNHDPGRSESLTLDGSPSRILRCLVQPIHLSCTLDDPHYLKAKRCQHLTNILLNQQIISS